MQGRFPIVGCGFRDGPTPCVQPGQGQPLMKFPFARGGPIRGTPLQKIVLGALQDRGRHGYIAQRPTLREVPAQVARQLWRSGRNRPGRTTMNLERASEIEEWFTATGQYQYAIIGFKSNPTSTIKTVWKTVSLTQ